MAASIVNELIELDREWRNVLALIDSLDDPKLVLELVDVAIGDHFDDPTGYVPKRQQTASLLEENRITRMRKFANQIGGELAARVEKNLGHFLYWRGKYDQAEELFLLAKQRFEASQNHVGIACTTWLLGYIADDENRFPEALQLYRKGLENRECRGANPKRTCCGRTSSRRLHAVSPRRIRQSKNGI